MSRSRKMSSALQQTVFVGPAVLVFALIVLVPFVMGMYYSFTSWNGVSDEVTWVGFKNFIDLFSNDPEFFNSFWFTTRFTICAVVLTNLLGFILAYMLTKPLKLRSVLRTIFLLPNVIGGLLLGFIWQFIFVKGFAAIGEATNIGFFQLPWLGDETTGFWALIIVSVWQGAGYLMIIYIAAMVNVPKELLEAAHLDGASRGQVLRHILLPLIMPAITVCLFLSIAWSFKMFDLNMSLTKGGPFRSTESVAMNIYAEAFQNNNYGLGAAKAFLFFIAVAVVSSLQVYVTKKKEVEM
ncbi:sugar ABC transporter permease [Paenibacillus sp. N1-5-1-14]|uniref:carbohydrate ABC transporter permease n=1 Tax=Paenibacillus radicibacter TaxID=2972488 RepID=UPI002159AC2F|nr:sugar ABC transporter permease [Paenibacillus radicibacter]MCR8645126.1 sugar ABC transporter permease [Paenibacillus radicibacter]